MLEQSEETIKSTALETKEIQATGCTHTHTHTHTITHTYHKTTMSLVQATCTVQTLYHRAKISFFALRGDCAHEKYLFILGVRD